MKLILKILMTVVTLSLAVPTMAKDKNPCMAKNPCAANPCSVKVTPIRSKAFTDNAQVLEMGEKLWADLKLGKGSMTCSTCHADGQGLKKTPLPRNIGMANDILTMDQMINFCMMNPMKGKALAWNSREMTALASYVQAHAKDIEAANPCGKNPCGKKNPCAMK